MKTLLHRFLLGLVLAASLLGPLYATWSICAVDTATGEVVVASATCLTGEDLKLFVPAIRVEVGCAAAQSYVNIPGRRMIYELLPLGIPPEAILDIVDEADNAPQGRQYGVVDLLGRAATRTGSGAGRWRGGRVGQIGTIVYAIQGNVLTGRAVIDEAENALVGTPGDLGQRVMAAMEAARSMGGDGRCSCNVFQPNSCGSPPASFTKSAHVACITLARPGDADGVCNGQQGCANGDYYLDLNVPDQHLNDPDPVLTLQTMYDAWRAGLAGRPDAVRSSVYPTEAAVAAGSPDPVAFVLDLADVEGAPLGAGGCAVSLQHDPRSSGLASLLGVTDHADGTYTLEVQPGAAPGVDRLRFVVDDGVRPVTLWPPAVLLHQPAEPAPFNDLEPVPGLDSPQLDRGARLLPDGLTAYVLSTRNRWPRELLRATRAGLGDPFGAAADVPNLNNPDGRYTGVWVSADELRVTLSGFAGGSSVEQLFRSSRESTAVPFPKPMLIAELDSGEGDGEPWLAADELTLYFHSRRSGGSGGWDLWRARRIHRDGPWLPAEPVASVNTAADERSPMLMENGMRLLFSRGRGPGTGTGAAELCFADLALDASFPGDAPLPGAIHPYAALSATAEEPGGGWLWISREGGGSGDLVRAARTSAALIASGDSLSVAAGGTLDFDLDAGSAWAGAAYFLGLGASGATPGLRLRDAVLPLAADGLTHFSRARANQPPFLMFAGQLDGLGRATAHLTLAPGAPVPPAFLNRPIRAAAMAVGGGSSFATNAVVFELVP